jgi:hypothetical protein
LGCRWPEETKRDYDRYDAPIQPKVVSLDSGFLVRRFRLARLFNAGTGRETATLHWMSNIFGSTTLIPFSVGAWHLSYQIGEPSLADNVLLGQDLLLADAGHVDSGC